MNRNLEHDYTLQLDLDFHVVCERRRVMAAMSWLRARRVDRRGRVGVGDAAGGRGGPCG